MQCTIYKAIPSAVADNHRVVLKGTQPDYINASFVDVSFAVRRRNFVINGRLNSDIIPLKHCPKLRPSNSLDFKTLPQASAFKYTSLDFTLSLSGYCVIQGYKYKKAFIVAQSPMESTIRDFWIMVVEQDCRAVVMLCALKEGGQVCHTTGTQLVTEVSQLSSSSA